MKPFFKKKKEKLHCLHCLEALFLFPFNITATKRLLCFRAEMQKEITSQAFAYVHSSNIKSPVVKHPPS